MVQSEVCILPSIFFPLCPLHNNLEANLRNHIGGFKHSLLPTMWILLSRSLWHWSRVSMVGHLDHQQLLNTSLHIWFHNVGPHGQPSEFHNHNQNSILGLICWGFDLGIATMVGIPTQSKHY